MKMGNDLEFPPKAHLKATQALLTRFAQPFLGKTFDLKSSFE